MQLEIIGIGQIANLERNLASHQTGAEVNVAGQAVQLGDDDGALDLAAAASAAANCGRVSNASAPLPVSTSTKVSVMVKFSAAANALMAAVWASRPRPERPCFWVLTRM